MTADYIVFEACRGALGACPHALALPEGSVGDLKAALERSGLSEAMSQRLARPPRHHESCRVALSACPNGCTRPHIADLGLIRAAYPVITADACSGCGACVEACPDGALSLADGVAVPDQARCLGCCICRKACPSGAIAAGAGGFRVLAAGRLGRRPRLAVERPGIVADAQIDGLVQRVGQVLADRYTPGKRFAQVLPENPWDALDAPGKKP